MSQLPLVEVFQSAHVLMRQNCSTILKLVRHVVAAVDFRFEWRHSLMKFLQRYVNHRYRCYARSTDMRYQSIALRCSTITCSRNYRPTTFTNSLFTTVAYRVMDRVAQISVVIDYRQHSAVGCPRKVVYATIDRLRSAILRWLREREIVQQRSAINR